MAEGVYNVETTPKALQFGGMLKSGVFYNDSNNDIYYNWDEAEKDISTGKDSFKIPGKSSRTVTMEETINRELRHINLISSAGTNSLYYDFVTWGESPEHGFDTKGNKTKLTIKKGGAPL